MMKSQLHVWSLHTERKHSMEVWWIRNTKQHKITQALGWLWGFPVSSSFSALTQPQSVPESTNNLGWFVSHFPYYPKVTKEHKYFYQCMIQFSYTAPRSPAPEIFPSEGCKKHFTDDNDDANQCLVVKVHLTRRKTILRGEKWKAQTN